MSAGSHTNSKLQQIQEQKKRLRDRIAKLDTNSDAADDTLSVQNGKSNDYAEKMDRLLERKKKLEEERERQAVMKKMQDEYIERRKQAEREKKMQKLQNDKRMI